MGQKNRTKSGKMRNLRPGQARSTGGPWIPIYAFFKATDLGSISSLNTLTTWFDETNHYFGLVRGIKASFYYRWLMVTLQRKGFSDSIVLYTYLL